MMEWAQFWTILEQAGVGVVAVCILAILIANAVSIVRDRLER